jgi:SnoaL-like domain
MYRAIIGMMVRRTWSQLAQRNPDAVLRQLAPRCEHTVAGDHALGGTRYGRSSIAAWFDRLFTLFPNLQLGVRDVLVAGWPWKTRVFVIVDITHREPEYRNVFVQRLQLRWGRVEQIVEFLEDPRALAVVLHRRAEDGIAEAFAPPIVDPPAIEAVV